MKILLLEDELPAGNKMLQHVSHTDPMADVNWVRSIREAEERLTSEDWQLIISDIELLDGNVFSLYQRITPNCPIIFCTAYDNYLIKAFQTNGIAYLLKPYTLQEFQSAWNKYDLLFQQNYSSHIYDTLKQLLNKSPKQYKTHFIEKKRDSTHLIEIKNIVYFQANGDYTYAFSQNNTKHLLDWTLGLIEESVDPHLFFRINRSEIISFQHIVKFEKYIKNRLAVHLKTHQVLYTSNSRSAEFRSWILNH